MIRLGYPNHPREDLAAEIDWIAANGFAFLDLNLEPDLTPENVDTAALRARLQRHGLGVTGHLAWYLPIGSAMKPLRAASVGIIRPHLDACAAVGAELVTVHADWPNGLFDADEGVAFQLESLRALLAEASARGLRLVYEPVPHRHDTPENLERILAALPELGCHLDLGHCNLFGKDPAAMLRRFASRLRHLHLHDNFGDKDLHLPPGAGRIDWDAVCLALEEIEYAGTITLEIFSPDREYILLARRRTEERLAAHGLTVAKGAS